MPKAPKRTTLATVSTSRTPSPPDAIFPQPWHESANILPEPTSDDSGLARFIEEEIASKIRFGKQIRKITIRISDEDWARMTLSMDWRKVYAKHKV